MKIQSIPIVGGLITVAVLALFTLAASDLPSRTSMPAGAGEDSLDSPRPDLVIDRVISAPEPRTALGDSLGTSIRVANIGEADSSETEVALFVNGIEQERRTLRRLPRSGNNAVNLYLSPGRAREEHLGETTFRFVIDPDDVVPELDETNNHIETTVTVIEEILPDLYFSTGEMRPGIDRDVRVGETFGFTYRLSYSRFPRGTEYRQITDDVSTAVIGRINGEQIYRQEFAYDGIYWLPSGPPRWADGETRDRHYESPLTHTFESPGEYTIEFILDPENQHAEDDENNNAISQTVTVLSHEEPSDSPTATPTHAATATPTPTVTATETPGPVISFVVDNTSINYGECTTIRWDVENISGVYFQDVGVTGHESRKVCPTKTETYTLQVEHAGGTEYRQITVDVIATPTPTPTLIPTVPVYSVSGQVNYGVTPLSGVTVELRSGSSTGAVMATDTTGADGSYVFPSIPPGTSYWVRLNAPSDDYVNWRAHNLTVEDEDVDRGVHYLPKVIALSPPGWPSPADGQTVTTSSDYIRLDWEENPDAADYQVQINVTDGWELIEQVWMNSTYPSYNAGSGGSLTDVAAQFESGVTYSWSVRAIDSEGNEVGDSEASYTFTIETP